RAWPRQPLCPTVTAALAIAATTTATAAPTYYTAMASLRVLAFDHEGRPVQFDTWLDVLQLYLLSDSKDSVSLFDLALGAATAPPATDDSSTRSRWLTRDAAARLAIRNHLPLAECAHFVQHRTAEALYDAVVARYSSRATAALGRLLLPYLFPELKPPPMYITLYFIVTRLFDSLHSIRDHFLSLDPTSLTVDLLEQHLLAAETSAVAVGAARGTPRPPFFEGCYPSPLDPSYASAAAADVSVPEDVRAAFAIAKCRSIKGKGGRGGGGGSDGGGGGSGSGGGGSSGGGGGGGTVGKSGGSGGRGGGSDGSGGSGGGGIGSGGTGARRAGSGGGQRQQQQRRSETPSPLQLREWFLRGASGGSCPYSRISILSAMYALSVSAEGDCYRCVPPGLGMAAAALGANESGILPGIAPAEALHTFTLDSYASRFFFRDSTTLIPLPAPVPVKLADPSGGPVVARSSTMLPCPAVPSGSLSSLHLPSFSTNLVSTASLQDAMVTTTTPGGQHVSICTCTRMGRHMATFTRRPGSSLYTLATEPSQVAVSAQVSASGQVCVSKRCPPLAHVASCRTRLFCGTTAWVTPPCHVFVACTFVFLSLVFPVSNTTSPVCAVRTCRRVPRPHPPPVPSTHGMALRPSSVPLRVPLPSPAASSLPDVPDPKSDLVRAAGPTNTRLLATVVTDPSFESTAASALVAKLVDFATACRLDYAASLVAESESVCPPSVGGECALGTDVLEERRGDFECLAVAVPHLVAMLLAPEGDPDAPDIPTPRSYIEAITGPYSSQWQTTMDAEMASLKSTSTYVNAVPLPGANIVDGMWIFRVKRPQGSPPVFKAHYVTRGFSQRQGVDFQTFSPTPKMTTLRVLLHVAAQREYELHSLDSSTTF
ncbi:unnamed protein product, partial [Closterium sp. NIES-54]